MSQLNVRHRRHLVLLLVMIAFIMVATRADASYRITSPMDASYGHIRQNYLYGIVDTGLPTHKGVDYTVPMDTYFYAVADGIIMQVQESYANTCEPGGQPPFQCPAFGNYVLIRHYQRHYNRTTGTMDNVYSLYAHLSQYSIPFDVGNSVNAGQIIGRTDDTGNSSGPHLHFQIMIDPDSNRTVTYPLTWTESNSRNPELWLTPYNSIKGTVIGKVTTTSGADLAGVLVYGLPKEAGWVPAYLSSQTYNDAALKPDDILVENWGTTDVTPGHWHVTTSLGGDLGWHDVVAGRITYVGLFPVWLPYLQGNYNNWNSQITVRNNSDTDRAQVNTTFLNSNGTVNSRRTDYINVKAGLTFSPPGNFTGSALVVPSEDVAVKAETQSSTASVSYVGNQSPATSAYLPNLIVTTTRQAYVSLQNAGASAATVSLNFYNRNGDLAHSRTETIPVNGTTTLLLNNIPQIVSGFASTSSTGSLFASVTNGVPIAASRQAIRDGRELQFFAEVFDGGGGALFEDFQNVLASGLHD